MPNNDYAAAAELAAGFTARLTAGSEARTASAPVDKATLQALLTSRYGATSAPGQHLEGTNDVIATMLQHRSVRAYSDKPVTDDTLLLLMSAAQSAATSSNLQAWSVIAVRDADRKARLAVCAGNQKHVAAAPLLLLFIADLSRLRRLSEQAGSAGTGLDYLETFVVAAADAAFAAQNTVVALESLGLGCCYIGGMRNKPEEVAKELALPSEAFALFGLTVGYPSADVRTDIKPRLPQPAVVHLEQYQPESPETLAGYNVSLNEFKRLQHMKEKDWTDEAAARVRGPESLSGRDRLFSALQALGFGLK